MYHYITMNKAPSTSQYLKSAGLIILNYWYSTLSYVGEISKCTYGLQIKAGTCIIIARFSKGSWIQLTGHVYNLYTFFVISDKPLFQWTPETKGSCKMTKNCLLSALCVNVTTSRWDITLSMVIFLSDDCFWLCTWHIVAIIMI